MDTESDVRTQRPNETVVAFGLAFGLTAVAVAAPAAEGFISQTAGNITAGLGAVVFLGTLVWRFKR